MIWRKTKNRIKHSKKCFKTSSEDRNLLSCSPLSSHISHDFKSQGRLSKEGSRAAVCLRTCRGRATAAVHNSGPEPRREETGAGLNTEQPPCESCWSLRHRRQSRHRHTPVGLPSLHSLPHHWSRVFCWRAEITWRELLMWKWHRTYWGNTYMDK